MLVSAGFSPCLRVGLDLIGTGDAESIGGIVLDQVRILFFLNYYSASADAGTVTCELGHFHPDSYRLWSKFTRYLEDLAQVFSLT